MRTAFQNLCWSMYMVCTQLKLLHCNLHLNACILHHEEHTKQDACLLMIIKVFQAHLYVAGYATCQPQLVAVQLCLCIPSWDLPWMDQRQ